MNKHTPGPWIHQFVEIGDEYGRHICDVYLTDEGGHSRMSNARLIAAAPDLLAACEMWLAADELMNELDPTAYNDACIEAHRATRAVMVKARGGQ